MCHNDANCDIYIGKGAGKKLIEDIQSAQKSIKIISPYLSPFLISELIWAKKRGIDVQLITVDKIEDYKNGSNKNIYELIKQNKRVDEEAEIKRDKWKRIAYSLLFSVILLSIIVASLFVYFKNEDIIFGMIPIVIMIGVLLLYKDKIKNKEIYYYSYSQLFPFKVYLSPERDSSSDTFIHAKVYIVDDAIAYLGSLNFTASGTKYNYETRIRTVDRLTVREIGEEFYELFNDASIPEVDIQLWGKALYKEPIN